MIKISVLDKIVSGENATGVVEMAIPNLATGDPIKGDFQPAPLKTVRMWAHETVILQTQIKRSEFLVPGKDFTNIQKQNEVSIFDSGVTDVAKLPYMNRRSVRLDQTLLQVRNGWQARIDAVQVADLNVEDAYETTIEAIEEAASIDEIKTALVAFLE